MLRLRKLTSSTLFLVAFSLFMGITPAATQPTQQQGPSVNEEIYEKVMDLVFPREILKNHKARFAFVLRYQPSFRRESQIVVVGRQDGIEVTTYSSVDGNIETRVNDMVRLGSKESAEQMARHFSIQTQNLKLSKDMAGKLHSEFFEALRLSEKVSAGAMSTSIDVIADGTTYSLWYTGKTDIHVELQGSDITTPTDADESPLVRWMKDISRLFLPTYSRAVQP